MRKFFVWFFGIVSFLFIASLLVGVFLPNDFEVSREIEIETTPEAAFALIGDLERWDEWGPWKEVDPEFAATLGDTTSGEGASMSWTDSRGNGRLVFTSVDPASGVAFDLLFNDDRFVNQSEIRFERAGSKLRVSWSMRGTIETPVLAGYLAMIVPEATAPLHEQGLRNMKGVLEGARIPVSGKE